MWETLLTTAFAVLGLIWFLYGLGLLGRLIFDESEVTVDWLNFKENITDGAQILGIVVLLIIAIVLFTIFGVVVVILGLLIGITFIVLGSFCTPFLIVVINLLKDKE